MNNFFAKLKFYAIKKFDYLFVKYLTVERGGGRRKFIWKTQNFREATQIHLPKLIFVIFSIVVIWKINDKIKSSIRKKDYYTTKSLREEIAYEEQQQIENYISIPNEFDPDKQFDAIKVEYKEKSLLDTRDLNDEELRKMQEFDEWIQKMKN